MDIKQTLSEFKKKIDREIEAYFDAAIEKESEYDEVLAGAIKYLKKLILAGGKRLRPAFMFYGYLGVGGKEAEKMLKASICIECIHLFLLVHDDVIDRDHKRHGIDSVNAHYTKMGKLMFSKKDHEHFGNSMAIMLGDRLDAMGNQILFDAKFPPQLIIKALSRLQDIVALTVIGEKEDIYIEYGGRATEREVLKMYEYKTARYTIEGPFALGAILGGADESFIKKIETFAIPMGIAFQIQDDILGIFGDEKKLGKPVGSDIREGKITLLVVKAREFATSLQRKELNKLLGNKNLTQKDIEKFRTIIKDTGALKYAHDLAIKLVGDGRSAIGEIDMAPEAKEFLLGVAEYMVKREV